VKKKQRQKKKWWSSLVEGIISCVMISSTSYHPIMTHFALTKCASQTVSTAPSLVLVSSVGVDKDKP